MQRWKAVAAIVPFRKESNEALPSFRPVIPQPNPALQHLLLWFNQSSAQRLRGFPRNSTKNVPGFQLHYTFHWRSSHTSELLSGLAPGSALLMTSVFRKKELFLMTFGLLPHLDKENRMAERETSLNQIIAKLKTPTEAHHCQIRSLPAMPVPSRCTRSVAQRKL